MIIIYYIQSFLASLSRRFKNNTIMLSQQLLSLYQIEECNYDKEFVKLLLSKYYSVLKNIFKRKEDFIYVQLYEDYYINIDSVANFIRKNESLLTDGFLSTNEIKHFKYLKSLVDYDKSKEQITDETLEYYYQQQYHKISNSKMVSLLLLEPQKFKSILKNSSNNELDDELVVALITFINNYTNNNYYLYPEYMKTNIEIVEKIAKSYNVLDPIKLKDKPSYLKRAKLNSKFKDRILKKVPQKFCKFSQAFYIYIKLCNILSHDEIYISKNVDYTIDHKNIRRIQEIDEDNHLVLCYEFVVVLALFFEELGIEYEIISNEKYGFGHPLINVKYKDTLINFEATNGLSEADLTKVKNNIQVGGVNIDKANPKDSEIIMEMMNQVYDYLEQEEQKPMYLEYELVEQFRQRIDNLSHLSNNVRFNIFKEEITKIPFNDYIDVSKSMKIWKKVLFKKDDVCAFSEILLRNSQYGKDKQAFIIAFNPNELKSEQKNSTEYYLYFIHGDFVPLSMEYITCEINSDNIIYLSDNPSIIPGIFSKYEEKKRRLFGD